jgi:hypothetical protein
VITVFKSVVSSLDSSGAAAANRFSSPGATFVAVMVAPGRSAGSVGCSGKSREIWSAPKTLTGSIVATTSVGMRNDGSMAICTWAWPRRSAMVVTRPTCTPRWTTADPGSRP